MQKRRVLNQTSYTDVEIEGQEEKSIKFHTSVFDPLDNTTLILTNRNLCVQVDEYFMSK